MAMIGHKTSSQLNISDSILHSPIAEPIAEKTLNLVNLSYYNFKLCVVVIYWSALEERE